MHNLEHPIMAVCIVCPVSMIACLVLCYLGWLRSIMESEDEE